MNRLSPETTNRYCREILLRSSSAKGYVPDPPAPDAYPIVTLTWIPLYRNYPDQADTEVLVFDGDRAGTTARTSRAVPRRASLIRRCRTNTCLSTTSRAARRSSGRS
jgi:hypothetical protein